MGGFAVAKIEMTDPAYRESPAQSGRPPEPSDPGGLPGWLKVIGCLLFLTLSCLLWLSIDSAFGKVLYYLLFFLPTWFCGEWLSGKVFNDDVGSMISNSEFSVTRVIFGVLFVVVLFGATWGLAALAKWMLTPVFQ